MFAKHRYLQWVFILLLVVVSDSFAEDWEVRTQLPPKRMAFATAVVGHKVYLIGGTVYEKAKREEFLGPLEFKLLRCTTRRPTRGKESQIYQRHAMLLKLRLSTAPFMSSGGRTEK